MQRGWCERKLRTPTDTESPTVQSCLPAARELPIPVFRRPCFLRPRAVGKMFKAKPEELAQEGACNKLCCLVLEIPEGTL